MKIFRISVTILMAVIGFSIHAQTEKGKLWLAGSTQLGLNQGGLKIDYAGLDETARYSIFDYSFQPKIAFTFIANMPVGVYFDISHSGMKDRDGGQSSRNSNYAGGPFIRYYYADLLGLKPYFEGSFGCGLGTQKFRPTDQDDWNKFDQVIFKLRLGTGATYYFNDHIGVDLFLGYNYERWISKHGYSQDDSDIKITRTYNKFVMQLGIVAMIKCRK